VLQLGYTRNSLYSVKLPCSAPCTRAEAVVRRHLETPADDVSEHHTQPRTRIGR
jgi:hypothetical protein